MNLVDEISDSIIILPQEIKGYLLNERRKDFLLNFKLYSLEEFESEIYGKISESAVSFLMLNYDFLYVKAKKIIQYISSNCCGEDLYDNIKKDLIKNNLMYLDPYYKELFKAKKFVFISYSEKDNEIKNLIAFLNIKDFKFVSFSSFFIGEKIKAVQCFKNIEEEIKYGLNIACKKLDEGKKIKVILDKKMYNFYFKIFEKEFSLKFNFGDESTLFTTYLAKILMNLIDDNFTLIEFLKEKTEYSTLEEYPYILNLLIKFNFDDLKNKKENFKEILSSSNLPTKHYENEIIVTNRISFDEGYEYLLFGFDDGFIPNVYVDDDYISDELKDKIGLETSSQKNIFILDLYNAFMKQKNLTYISFHEIDSSGLKRISYFFYKFNMIKEENKYLKEQYSEVIARFFYASYDYYYLKYHEINDEYLALKMSYSGIEKYDYSYKNFNVENFRKPIYSYTMINDYNSCHFKFFCSNLLNLNHFEETFALKYGNYAHEILSYNFEKNAVFDSIREEVFKKSNFNEEDLIFMDRLDDELHVIWDDNLSRLDQEDKNNVKIYTEESIVINLENEIKFKGKIDFFVTFNNDFCYIVDYKTGSSAFSLDQINNGFSLQLPLYSFLINRAQFLPSVNIIGVYLSPILNNVIIEKSDDCETQPSRNILFSNKLNGITIDNMDLIDKYLDKSLKIQGISSFFEGVKIKKDGSLKQTKQIISQDGIKNISIDAEKQIYLFDNNLSTFDFSIEPTSKDKNSPCAYCAYKDICFFKGKLKTIKGVNDETNQESE